MKQLPKVNLMNRIARIRPSSLVILSVLPFVIYLFTMVPNYRRSIIAIVGIEANAAQLLADFAAVVAILVLGLVWPLLARRGKANDEKGRAIALLAIVGNVVTAAALAAFGDISAFVASVAANALDAETSDLVAKAVSPRQLTPEGFAIVAEVTARYTWLYLYAATVLAVPAVVHLTTGALQPIARWSARGMVLLNGAGLVYLILGGIFAYILACCLGLVWAGLLHVSPSRRTTRKWAIACVACFAFSAVLWVQPHSSYVLVGSLDKRVAIIKGTPKALVDTIRFGQFDEDLTEEVGLRSAATPEQALDLLAKGELVTGALLPAELAPADMPVLWETSFLPTRYQLPAVFLMVGGILLSLLTFSAYQHGRHPLSVSAEFFIDTVRGIPMLVIILFVGLPFAGALKDVSGGTIDMPNVLRGVIAVAIGYSAYLAEIFRAGIDAVPSGQVEAARSLGLNNYKVARLVVLPQAFRIVLPALGNEFIAILKDTSLLSILSVRDVTQRMREFQSASFLPFAPFNSAAILYVFLTLAAASLIASIERRFDVKSR